MRLPFLPPLLARVGVSLWWVVVLGSVAALGLFAWRPYRVGPEQPLPFSHKVHAGYKEISCLFCHNAADRSPDAGMPETERCLLCHQAIITNFEPIRKLRAYRDSGQPTPWVRVYRLQDFTFFNHQRHVRRDVDCGVCHGDVKAMDRIILNQPLTMRFCVDCHRRPEYQVSVDCWLCHR